MAGFSALRDICAVLRQDLQEQSATLFSANAEETVEDAIQNKLNDLSLLTSKKHLLNAAREASSPQVEERVLNNTNVIKDLEDVIQNRLIEEAVAKSLRQNIVLKRLLTSPDEMLDPELLERKLKIKELYEKLLIAETNLQDLSGDLERSEEAHSRVRKEWDEALGDLKENTTKVTPEVVSSSDPSYIKLSEIVDKIEIIRHVISQLFTSRTHYDWMEDPQDIFGILGLTRDKVTVETFLEE